MIEKKFTKGPWDMWRGPLYVGGGEDICIGAGETWLANMDHRSPACPVGSDVYKAHEHAETECDICSMGEVEITEEQLANATLIQAAPEMFDLLETIKNMVDAHLFNDMELYPQTISNLCNSVLTKATTLVPSTFNSDDE